MIEEKIKIKKEKSDEWVVGFGIALVVGIIYNFAIDIIEPFFHFISKIVGPPLDLTLFFGLPGILSCIIFYTYSRNLIRSVVIGIVSILAFLIVFILTLTRLPGIP